MYSTVPYLATDYATQLSLLHTIIDWWFLYCWCRSSRRDLMVRDPTNNYNNLLDRVIRQRDAMISHLNWVCIF
jgi:photosystem I P700 chlorophyll a apoprotein A1